MNAKWILQSWTFWVNAASLAIFVIQWYLGSHVVSPDVQALLTALVNILLRFKTTQPVTLRQPL